MRATSRLTSSLRQFTLYPKVHCITEAAMDADAAREDIAFIRRSIEQGRRIAGAWSPDMLVWGIAIAMPHTSMSGLQAPAMRLPCSMLRRIKAMSSRAASASMAASVMQCTLGYKVNCLREDVKRDVARMSGATCGAIPGCRCARRGSPGLQGYCARNAEM